MPTRDRGRRGGRPRRSAAQPGAPLTELRHYQQLASLRDVLIVSYRQPRVTVVSRSADDSWSSSDLAAGASFEVPSLGCRISVDDIFSDGLEDA